MTPAHWKAPTMGIRTGPWSNRRSWPHLDVFFYIMWTRCMGVVYCRRNAIRMHYGSIYGGPTSHLTGLKGCAADVLVPDTRGYILATDGNLYNSSEYECCGWSVYIKLCWLTSHRQQLLSAPLPPCMATALVTKSTVGLDQNKPGYSFRDLGKSWSGRPSYSHSSSVCVATAAHHESVESNIVECVQRVMKHLKNIPLLWHRLLVYTWL